MKTFQSFGVNGDPCPRCRALGWVSVANHEWPETCPVCLGTTVEPTLYRIAARIEEHRTTLYRLRDCRVSGPTAGRLLGKLVAFAAANRVLL